MSIFDQLNLRPQERRVLVIVLFLVFVVLNFLFVRPLFGDFGRKQGDLDKARLTLERYQEEIGKAPGYERLETQLKSKGAEVLSEELQLQRIVDNQARVSDVAVSRYAPGVRTAVRTNQFFEDQGLTIDFTSHSTNLVEFLVGLAFGNSMIHVQDMNLRPDGSGTKLAGNILFVASYQKKQAAPPRTSGAVAKPLAAAAKPKPLAATNNAAASKVKTVPTNSATPAAATRRNTNTVKALSTNSVGTKK